MPKDPSSTSPAAADPGLGRALAVALGHPWAVFNSRPAHLPLPPPEPGTPDPLATVNVHLFFPWVAV